MIETSIISSESSDKDGNSGNNENSDKGYILQNDLDYPNELQKAYHGLPFLSEKMKLINVKSLCVICMTSKICHIHENR